MEGGLIRSLAERARQAGLDHIPSPGSDPLLRFMGNLDPLMSSLDKRRIFDAFLEELDPKLRGYHATTIQNFYESLGNQTANLLAGSKRKT